MENRALAQSRFTAKEQSTKPSLETVPELTYQLEPTSILEIRTNLGKSILEIFPDGTVRGELENMGEAAALFVGLVRHSLNNPPPRSLDEPQYLHAEMSISSGNFVAPMMGNVLEATMQLEDESISIKYDRSRPEQAHMELTRLAPTLFQDLERLRGDLDSPTLRTVAIRVGA